MDANADNAAEEIHSHPPPEVSVTRHSPTESVVQALVADQSILSTLSQAIVSVIKEDLPGHAIDQSRAEKAAAPVGQSAEQSAVESVDQTGKVKATKRRLPIDVVVIDENTQSKRPRGDKSTSYSSSLQADQSSANEDNDLDGLLSPNSRWEPSEEFDTLLKALLKPLQCFERRTIIREFPRPASEGAFTPNLDNYLNSMISGAKTPDNSLRDIQDKILDVLGPLCALHENFTLMQVPRAFSGWQRSIQSPLPRLLSPHIKLSDHKHIIQGQEQSPIYPVPRAISAKTTSIVPARPSHLPSGMFRDFLNFPNNLPQAGQVKHFLATWEQITKDPWVLQVVSGYQIEFLDNPVQRNTPPPIPCSLDHQTIIDQEVWELLSKEAVHFVQPDSLQEPGFISSLFVIPKKGGGHRPAINLKPLNCFIPYEHFKMESIHMLKDLLKKGDYMVKIDLKDACLGVFNCLHQKWGPLNIDLFASRLSYQLDQFVSWRPDPLAIHTDAFTLDWATFRGYAFPPFALIGRCLHQIQSQQVSHMVFVAPVWPAQPWYPLLLDLCIDFPLLLPVQEDLLTQGSRTHPLKHLQLAWLLLSAVVTKRQTFLRRVEKSSWQPGGKIQLVPIPLPGQNGVAGVVNRSMLIPFHHL